MGCLLMALGKMGVCMGHPNMEKEMWSRVIYWWSSTFNHLQKIKRDSPVYLRCHLLYLKNEVLCKYTRIASYVHARAAPDNSFDPSIKGACQAREFPYVSRDLHLGSQNYTRVKYPIRVEKCTKDK